MKRIWILTAVICLGVGGALAFEKTHAANIAPLSKQEAALKKCELHKIALQLGTASILYGKRNEVVDFATSKRAFPHARSYVLGGCVLSKNSPFLRAVKFCPQCRAAEKRWLVWRKVSLPLQ